ncbi:MAG TPA: hypothetical protein VF457_15440 [Burkholderiaceae bacterium]
MTPPQVPDRSGRRLRSAPPKGKAEALPRLFAWLNALVFAGAAGWGTVAGSGPYPLPGLRRISENPLVAWPVALLAAGVAIQLSVSRLRTRERLLFMSGALACGGFVLAMYVSSGAAVGFALLAGALHRHAAAAGSGDPR